MDERYWTRNCHGFRVDSANGRLGIVEDVLYGTDPERPAALAVRGGLFGTRVELVPIEQLAVVEPSRRRVKLLPATDQRPRRAA